MLAEPKKPAERSPLIVTFLKRFNELEVDLLEEILLNAHGSKAEHLRAVQGAYTVLMQYVDAAWMGVEVPQEVVDFIQTDLQLQGRYDVLRRSVLILEQDAANGAHEKAAELHRRLSIERNEEIAKRAMV